MSQVRIAPAAQSEIEALADAIAADNPAAAERVRDAIFAAVRRLGERPGIGHRREDLTTRPLRFWNVMGRYTTVYQHHKDVVDILRVFGPGRDIRKRLR